MSHDDDDFECIPGLNRADLNKLFQEAVKDTDSPRYGNRRTRRASSVPDSLVYVGPAGLALLFLCLMGYYSSSSEIIRTQTDANHDLTVKYSDKKESISIVKTIVSQESAPRNKEEAEELVLALQRTAARHNLPPEAVPSTEDIHEDGSIQWIAD